MTVFESTGTRGASRVRKWTRGITRRAWARNISFIAAVLLIGLVTLTAIWPSLFAPHDPLEIDLRARLQPPGYVGVSGDVHLLGTDQLGRDLLSRMIHGSRVSLTVGYVGVTIAGVFGTVLGILAGYRRGILDTVSMRVVDAWLSFPYILIALVWAALIGTDMASLIIIGAGRGWVSFARVARGQALSVRERDYVMAAEAMGMGDWRILFRHVLPNSLAPIFVIASFQLGLLILLESLLSFLGLGIQPPTPAWGSMLSDARPYIATAWWVTAFPGIILSITVLSANLLGDSLRDILDPALRE